MTKAPATLVSGCLTFRRSPARPKKKAAPKGAASYAELIALHAIFRRRRNNPRPTRAEPKSARDAGSGVRVITAGVSSVLEQAIAAPTDGCEHEIVISALCPNR